MEDLDVDDQQGFSASQQIPYINMSQSSLKQMSAVRDDVAGRIWLDYCNKR